VSDAAAATPAKRRSGSIAGLVVGVLAVAMFSGTLPANRIAVVDLSPWFLTAGRGVIGGAIAVVTLTIARAGFPKESLWWLVGIAITLIVGVPAATAIASITVPASHGAVVLGLLPLATAIAAVWIAGERPSIWFWILGVVGAAIVAIYPLRGGDVDVVTGDVWLALAVILTGVGYALSGTVSRTLPGWQVIAWALVLTLPMSLVASVALWPPDATTVRWTSWAGLLYTGIVVQFIAYALWNVALAVGGVARVGQLQVLQPFFTIAIAAIVLGETVGPDTVLFAAAVVFVVALSRRTTIRQQAFVHPK
jgi:drug/metabolite transporter (DMT)-like permease